MGLSEFFILRWAELKRSSKYYSAHGYIAIGLMPDVSRYRFSNFIIYDYSACTVLIHIKINITRHAPRLCLTAIRIKAL